MGVARSEFAWGGVVKTTSPNITPEAIFFLLVFLSFYLSLASLNWHKGRDHITPNCTKDNRFEVG